MEQRFPFKLGFLGGGVMAEAIVRENGIKPDVVPEALRSVKDGWKPEKHLLVSICAGVGIGTLESHLVSKSKVIRVMPNTPCLVGEAAVAFSCVCTRKVIRRCNRNGGVLNGLPRDVSLSLATQTVLGAAKMVASGNEHPAKLRNAVESPGGTTIHGTSTLEKHHFRNAVIQAVTAATNRAKELGGSK
ncbi:Pyrroline-5-carboxylate reductase [Galdieria sulphuraria]|nr:Pyrroline-5-carboxylate reductase [Galdieria sulphuraria]